MLVLIGGIYGTQTERSMGDLVEVPVRSLRDAGFRDDSYLSSWGVLTDARLVPLATPEAVPTLRGDAPSPPGVRGEAGEETLGAAGASGGIDVWEPSTSGGIEAVHDVRPVHATFFDGYRDAGGTDEDRIAMMIWCESSWRIDPGGWHLGLAQFDPGSWATVSGITGYTDPYNAYDQGYNVSVWSSMVSPGTSAGWPNCFHAIDW